MGTSLKHLKTPGIHLGAQTPKGQPLGQTPIQLSLCLPLPRSSVTNSMEEHMQKALYIVCYLSSTKNLCIQYSVTGNQNRLCAYLDTDWAGDIETSHSTIGYAVFLGNSIVSWLSRQQWRVTLSFTEAKFCVAHWMPCVWWDFGTTWEWRSAHKYPKGLMCPVGLWEHCWLQLR